MKLRHVNHCTFDKVICAISIICLAVVLVLVLVLKDSLRTYFKSLFLSWSLGVRSLSLSLGVRSRRSLSLFWSLGVRSLSLSWSLGIRSLLTSLLASKIELLSNDLNSWMSSNRLSLNSAKTQLIWFGTPQQLLKLDHALLSDRFPHFTFHTTVRDLGVTLDS